MNLQVKYFLLYYGVQSYVPSKTNCCEKISITDCQRTNFNGVYSTTGRYNGKDYYVKENGRAYMYYSSVTNSWHINYNVGDPAAVIKGQCCDQTCPSYDNWQEQLNSGEMVNLNKGRA